MSDKKRILMCKLMGVEGDFGLRYDPKFLSLALYYLKEYACKDPRISDYYEFFIKTYPLSKNDEYILEDIYSEKPCIIAFSAYLPEIDRTVSLCRKIKYILPNALIIIGGPSIGDSQSFLSCNKSIDIVVRSEGEAPFYELLKTLIDGNDFSQIKGITYRADGKITKNPDRPLDFDVNSIPFIFTDEFMEGTSGIATCETTRGCRNHCRFCGIGRSLTRNYSIDRIERDLKHILSNKNIRRLFIGDSDFFADRDRTVKLLEILIKYNVHKTQIEFYSDFLGVDEEMLKECRRAYIHDSLRIPLQTLTKKALQESHREWFDFERVKKNAQAVIKYFPTTNAELIYGLPGDNYEGIKRSLIWCAEAGLINPKLHRLQNLPGSAYTRHSEMYGLVADERSPHYVYYSNTFSYEDSLRVEALSRNLQAIYSFLFPSDYHFLLSLGINIFDIAENISVDMPEWESSFIHASEANISEAKPEAAELLLNYIIKAYNIDDARRNFLKDMFRYRYEAKKLYVFFREAVLYNADIDTKPSLGKGAYIPKYAILDISHNIKDVLDPASHDLYMAKKKQNIYFLYSNTEPGVIPVKIRDGNLFKETLRNLDGSHDTPKTCADYISSRIGCKYDEVLPLLERLFQRGFIFYARPDFIKSSYSRNSELC